MRSIRTNGIRRLHRVGGFKLLEMMIGIAIATLVVGMAMSLYIFGLRSFGAIGNYASMDANSRQALDLMLREIRQASMVVGMSTNAPTTWISVAYTNSPAVTNTFAWDSTTNALTWAKTGQPTRVLLTGCGTWSFTCYGRAPDINGNFVPISSLSKTKLINLSWSCSRTNVWTRNSESMVSAEVVLRNLQE